MIVSVSYGLLLLILVCTLIAARRLPALGALASALLGFHLADTALASPVSAVTGTCLHLVSQITSHIA